MVLVMMMDGKRVRKNGYEECKERWVALETERGVLEMSILSWNHTRKGTPMKQSGSYGFLMITVMMVRSSYPNHPMFIDGNPV
jgi:hypothetical protein